MKTTILGLAMILVSTLTLAQERERVIEFQGIPVDGTLELFEQRLAEKGWVYQKEQRGRTEIIHTYMTGQFEGTTMYALAGSTADSLVSSLILFLPGRMKAKEAISAFNHFSSIFLNDSNHYHSLEPCLLPANYDLEQMTKQNPNAFVSACFFQYDRAEEQSIVNEELRKTRTSEGFRAMTPEQQRAVLETMKEQLSLRFAEASSMRSVCLQLYEMGHRKYQLCIYFRNGYDDFS